MPLWIDVRWRRLQSEIMDQPGLDRQQHVVALRGLERINRLSRSAGTLWPRIRSLARQGGPVRVLDVASGGGDVPIRLWQLAHDAGLSVQIDGCDRSAEAVAYARRQAERHRAPVGFFQADALEEELPPGYHVLTSSLFLHHLDAAQAVQFLRRMGEAAGRLVLSNDLERSAAGWLAAYLGTRLLSSSPVVHVDGVRSVEGAFTLAEVQNLAEQAGLRGAKVIWRWPFRYLLSWRRP